MIIVKKIFIKFYFIYSISSKLVIDSKSFVSLSGLSFLRTTTTLIPMFLAASASFIYK